MFIAMKSMQNTYKYSNKSIINKKPTGKFEQQDFVLVFY